MTALRCALLIALVTGPSWVADASAGALRQAPAGMAAVGPAKFRPLYAPPKGPAEVDVKRFFLDREPVTNGQYLRFLRTHPKWRRDHIPRLFADDTYLGRWAGALKTGKEAPLDAPVTEVSWFAARAYCEARHARLPTENEWELAAAASRTQADARDSAAWRERILAWYARPLPARLPDVGRTPPNYWGVRDLHGLVWEWVLDYDGALGADGAGAKAQGLRFCAAQALGADVKTDYASFMRYALRSSLEAQFTLASLGFRCAADAENRR